MALAIWSFLFYSILISCAKLYFSTQFSVCYFQTVSFSLSPRDKLRGSAGMRPSAPFEMKKGVGCLCACVLWGQFPHPLMPTAHHHHLTKHCVCLLLLTSVYFLPICPHNTQSHRNASASCPLESITNQSNHCFYSPSNTPKQSHTCPIHTYCTHTNTQ